MLEMLLAGYLLYNSADIYFIGFILRGVVYGGYFHKLPMEAVKLDHESSARGGSAKLRLRFRKAVKLDLIASGKVKPIGVEDDLLKDSRYNLGDNFERHVAEINGITGWKKNSDPFWMGGDLFLNGQKVQVKFDNCEIVNEKSLAAATAYAKA